MSGDGVARGPLTAADIEAVMERLAAEPYRPKPHLVHPVSRRCSTCGGTHPARPVPSVDDTDKETRA